MDHTNDPIMRWAWELQEKLDEAEIKNPSFRLTPHTFNYLMAKMAELRPPIMQYEAYNDERLGIGKKGIFHEDDKSNDQ